MSETSVEMRGGSATGARALLDRAATADARTRHTLTAAIDDVFLPADARLDDRTRAALTTLLGALVATVEDEIREHGTRLLITRGEAALAAGLAEPGAPLVERLAAAGVLRDSRFLDECIARVRVELTSAAIAPHAPDGPELPSLLVRLARSTDRVVAAAASAVLAGESHRRATGEGGQLAGTGLPTELHRRLVWGVAAAMRERHAEVVSALDRALAEAAVRNLTAHDEGDRLEGAAMRLAAAIDAQADELPALILEALGDRRVSVFTALIATALGVSYELMREIVLDPLGDRLWLVLRALDTPRDVIAKIGYLLSEADPRRDVELFADSLNAVWSVEPAAARVAVAPLTLHPDFRAALLALTMAGMRR